MKLNQKGFTVIELMIATTVFSVILLLCTYGILSVGRTYYKGVTSAKTQEVARTIIEEVSRDIQFGGGAVVSQGASMYCVGSNRYSYVLNTQKNDANNVLVKDNIGACSGSTAAQDMNNLSSSSKEMMGGRMRLAKFDVAQDGSSQLYSIKVRVVYGDDDLLTGSGDTLGCVTGGSGSEFCSVSELNTTVQKRVQ